MKNVLVFFGGESVEHDVSVLTGVITLNALKKSEYNPVPVYVSKKGVFYTGEELFEVESFKNLNEKNLKQVALMPCSTALYVIKGNKKKPILNASVAINCMHGGLGEDGSLAGLLNFSGIPLASPNVLPSAVCMSKSFTKIFLKGLKINALECRTIYNVKEIYDKDWSFPLIVKPNSQGSSIGIERVENFKELESATLKALRYSVFAIIEPCLTNFIEINCACYKCFDEMFVSPCEKPQGAKEVLTFADKYVSGEREFPANIKKQTAEKIKNITKKIYSALELNGIIRVDFLIDEEGKIFVNEINTTPGSLAYYLFSERLEEFASVLTDLLKDAEQKVNAQKTLVKSFSSCILDLKGCKSAKRL